MGTDGVKVTQQSHVHGGVCLADIFQHVLVHDFGCAVGVRGSAHGEILTDGHAGGGRRKP